VNKKKSLARIQKQDKKEELWGELMNFLNEGLWEWLLKNEKYKTQTYTRVKRKCMTKWMKKTIKMK